MHFLVEPRFASTASRPRSNNFRPARCWRFRKRTSVGGPATLNSKAEICRIPIGRYDGLLDEPTLSGARGTSQVTVGYTPEREPFLLSLSSFLFPAVKEENVFFPPRAGSSVSRPTPGSFSVGRCLNNRMIPGGDDIETQPSWGIRCWECECCALGRDFSTYRFSQTDRSQSSSLPGQTRSSGPTSVQFSVPKDPAAWIRRPSEPGAPTQAAREQKTNSTCLFPSCVQTDSFFITALEDRLGPY
jgi:hypothetical protein